MSYLLVVTAQASRRVKPRTVRVLSWVAEPSSVDLLVQIATKLQLNVRTDCLLPTSQPLTERLR